MSSPQEQCTYTTAHPSSVIGDLYWESWQPSHPRTMGDIMKTVMAQRSGVRTARMEGGHRLIGF